MLTGRVFLDSPGHLPSHASPPVACYAAAMAMIIFSALGLLFALAVFYGARQILRKLEEDEEDTP